MMVKKVWIFVAVILLVVILLFVFSRKKECMERTRKVIDTFTFFNELDLLEKRLVYMDPYVDYFVISESPTTHSGNEKPFYFEQNADRFSKWKDKIVYIKTKPLGDGFWDREKYKHLIINHSNREDSWERWEREGQQRFAIEEELKNFDDTDIVIHSDLDEIPDMSKVDLNNIGDEIYKCKQRIFRYSFDYMVDTDGFDWDGPIICSNKNAKEKGFITLRGHRYEYKPIPECGWHMTKFGTDEEALNILKSYAHAGEKDYVKHTKDKTSWETGNPLIKTSQDIKDSIPDQLLGLSNSKKCLLLTCCVNAGRGDDEIIIKWYTSTINKYLETTNLHIRAVESSGYKFLIEHNRFKQYNFTSDLDKSINFPTRGEAESIIKANESGILEGFDTIIKLSGKYYVPELEKEINNIPNNVGIIYQNIKNEYNNTIASEIFGFQKQYIENIFSQMNTEMFEKCIYNIHEKLGCNFHTFKTMKVDCITEKCPFRSNTFDEIKEL